MSEIMYRQMVQIFCDRLTKDRITYANEVVELMEAAFNVAFTKGLFEDSEKARSEFATDMAYKLEFQLMLSCVSNVTDATIKSFIADNIGEIGDSVADLETADSKSAADEKEAVDATEAADNNKATDSEKAADTVENADTEGLDDSIESDSDECTNEGSNEGSNEGTADDELSIDMVKKNLSACRDIKKSYAELLDDPESEFYKACDRPTRLLIAMLLEMSIQNTEQIINSVNFDDDYWSFIVQEKYINTRLNLILGNDCFYEYPEFDNKEGFIEAYRECEKELDKALDEQYKEFRLKFAEDNTDAKADSENAGVFNTEDDSEAVKEDEEKNTEQKIHDAFCEKIDSLFGNRAAKYFLANLLEEDLIKLKLKCVCPTKKNPFTYVLYMAGKKGCGREIALGALGKAWAELGIIDADSLFELDGLQLSKKNNLVFDAKLNEILNTDKMSLVVINNFECLLESENRDVFLEKIVTFIRAAKDAARIIICCEYSAASRSLLENRFGFADTIRAFIEFEDLSVQDMLVVFDYLCKQQGYLIDGNAMDMLTEYFLGCKKTADFENVNTVQKTFEKLLEISNESNKDVMKKGIKIITENNVRTLFKMM